MIYRCTWSAWQKCEYIIYTIFSFKIHQLIACLLFWESRRKTQSDSLLKFNNQRREVLRDIMSRSGRYDRLQNWKNADRMHVDDVRWDVAGWSGSVSVVLFHWAINGIGLATFCKHHRSFRIYREVPTRLRNNADMARRRRHGRWEGRCISTNWDERREKRGRHRLTNK